MKTEKICECKVKGCNSISPGHQQYHKPKGLLANEIKSGELRAVSLGPTCTHIYEGEMKTKQKPGEYRLISLNYGPFRQRNMHRTLDFCPELARKGIKCARAKEYS